MCDDFRTERCISSPCAAGTEGGRRGPSPGIRPMGGRPDVMRDSGRRAPVDSPLADVRGTVLAFRGVTFSATSVSGEPPMNSTHPIRLTGAAAAAALFALFTVAAPAPAQETITSFNASL